MHEHVLGRIEQFRASVPYELSEEALRPVSDATVAYCDVTAIRRDFPWVPEGAEEDWLLSVGQLLSDPNCRENAANAEVATDSGAVPAHRPPRYGRAAIVDSAVASGLPAGELAHRLVETKGCGVSPKATPALASNANGLLTTPDAFKELINARLLDKLFCAAQTEVSCIPLYGIVNLNITTGVEYASHMPCCTLVRASHVRPPENVEVPASGSSEVQVKHRIEETLRRFGLTSALNSYAFHIYIDDGVPKATFIGKPVDWGEPEFFTELLDELEMTAPQTFRFTNVQMTDSCSLAPLSATLVDLSHYIYEEDFNDHVLVTAVSDRPFNIGLLEKDGCPHHEKGLALRPDVMLPKQMSPELISFFRCMNTTQRCRGVDRLAHDLAMQVEQIRPCSIDIDAQIRDFISAACSAQSAVLEHSST